MDRVALHDVDPGGEAAHRGLQHERAAQALVLEGEGGDGRRQPLPPPELGAQALVLDVGPEELADAGGQAGDALIARLAMIGEGVEEIPRPSLEGTHRRRQGQGQKKERERR